MLLSRKNKNGFAEPTPRLGKLYDSDRVAWLDTTVALIKQCRLRELDSRHLQEYLRYWARRDREEVRQRLLPLLTHYLRVRFSKHPDKRSELALLHQQFQMEQIIESPSLKELAERLLPRAYAVALE